MKKVLFAIAFVYSAHSYAQATHPALGDSWTYTFTIYDPKNTNPDGSSIIQKVVPIKFTWSKTEQTISETRIYFSYQAMNADTPKGEISTTLDEWNKGIKYQQDEITSQCSTSVPWQITGPQQVLYKNSVVIQICDDSEHDTGVGMAKDIFSPVPGLFEYFHYEETADQGFFDLSPLFDRGYDGQDDFAKQLGLDPINGYRIVYQLTDDSFYSDSFPLTIQGNWTVTAATCTDQSGDHDCLSQYSEAERIWKSEKGILFEGQDLRTAGNTNGNYSTLDLKDKEFHYYTKELDQSNDYEKWIDAIQSTDNDASVVIKYLEYPATTPTITKLTLKRILTWSWNGP